MPKLPCITCGLQDRAAGRTKCYECWLAGTPIAIRQGEAEWRLSAIPEPLRLGRVPKEDWPEGRRWCSGCQSFVRLADVPKKGSRCKTCTSVSAHGGMVARTYGISAKEYAMLLKAQHGRCYICRELPRSKRLAVDHDHKTGKVRGLLCADSDWGCNYAILGKIKDVAMARRIVSYLVNPPADSVLSQS